MRHLLIGLCVCVLFGGCSSGRNGAKEVRGLVLPEILVGIDSISIDRIEYGHTVEDYGVLHIWDGEVVRSARPTSMGDYQLRSRRNQKPLYQFRDHDILLWQTKVVSEDTVANALILGKYVDSTGTDGYALLLLSRLTVIDRWVLAEDDELPLQRFTRKPTPSDVFALLDRQTAIESHLFLGDTSTVYDWKGVPVKFLDGDVIDETWEEVFGEKPTRHFPNGK